MKKTTLAVVAFVAGGAATSAVRSAPALLGPQAVSWQQIEAATGKGLSKPIFRSPSATLDELEMHVTHLPAGKAPHPPHSHPEEELVIIKEGTLEATQNGKTTRLGPGAVIFQASNQTHGVLNVGEGPATYYVVRWKSPGKPQTAPTKP
jgi:quercetin dioxygenase-like cupin family protein